MAITDPRPPPPPATVQSSLLDETIFLQSDRSSSETRTDEVQSLPNERRKGGRISISPDSALDLCASFLEDGLHLASFQIESFLTSAASDLSEDAIAVRGELGIDLRNRVDLHSLALPAAVLFDLLNLRLGGPQNLSFFGLRLLAHLSKQIVDAVLIFLFFDGFLFAQSNPSSEYEHEHDCDDESEDNHRFRNGYENQRGPERFRTLCDAAESGSADSALCDTSRNRGQSDRETGTNGDETYRQITFRALSSRLGSLFCRHGEDTDRQQKNQKQ